MLIYYHTTGCCEAIIDNFKNQASILAGQEESYGEVPLRETLHHKVPRKLIDSAVSKETTCRFSSSTLLEYFHQYSNENSQLAQFSDASGGLANQIYKCYAGRYLHHAFDIAGTTALNL